MRQLLESSVARFKGRPILALGVAAWAIAGVALALRLPYGAGTTDESFYAAMPYGFLLGNKPYQDELAFHQNAGILLMPFFRVYVGLFGTEGILVFNRWLYFAYIGLCSALAFRLVRKLTSASTGAWVAALVLTFSYFNLFTLSYNTMGALGLLAGILLSTEAMLGRPVPKLIAASFFLAAGAFSYPTFSLVAVAHSTLVLLRLRRRVSREEYRRILLTVGLCTLVIAALAAAFLAWVTPAGIERALEFSRGMGYGKRPISGAPNFTDSPLWEERYYLLAYGLLLALMPLLLKRVRRAALPLALIVPAVFVLIYWRAQLTFTILSGGIFWLTCPLLAPVCLALAPDYPHRRMVLEQLWAPGVISLVIVSGTSANGPFSAHLGALPALIAGMVSLSALVSNVAGTENTRAALAAKWLFATFSAALLGTQLHTMFRWVYDFDARLSSHTTRVQRGPYRGAMATPESAKMMETLDADLKTIEDPSKTIAAFDQCSVVYMSTRMRPRVFSHWVLWVFEARYGAKITRETYGAPEKQPDFLVLFPPWLKKRNLFLRYRSNYQTVIDRPELGYVIQKRVGTVLPASAPVPRRSH